MTNKRKHKLERSIRIEYETILIGKTNSERILTQLFNLLLYKIEYKFIYDIITYEEKTFMKKCNINYLYYYQKMIANIYD